MYIFLPVLGGGQDKPAWTACPPGGEDNHGGGQDIRGKLAPPPPPPPPGGGGGGGGGKPTAVALPPRGHAVQGGQDKLGHRLTKCHFLVHSNMHNAPYIHPRHDLILVL